MNHGTLHAGSPQPCHAHPFPVPALVHSAAKRRHEQCARCSPPGSLRRLRRALPWTQARGQQSLHVAALPVNKHRPRPASTAHRHVTAARAVARPAAGICHELSTCLRAQSYLHRARSCRFHCCCPALQRLALYSRRRWDCANGDRHPCWRWLRICCRPAHSAEVQDGVCQRWVNAVPCIMCTGAHGIAAGWHVTLMTAHAADRSIV